MKSVSKIQYYYWRGINSAGRRVTGISLGFKEQEVRHQLKQQMIKIKKLKPKTPSTYYRFRNDLNASDVTSITRQLSIMLEANLPIVQAINLIANSQQKAGVKATLHHIITQVEAGASLSQAMRSTSLLFDSFYCDLIRTGEQTGRLDQLVERIAIYREKSERLRKKVIKAMIYPTIVTIVALLVVLLMLTVVIPQFTAIFDSFDAKLPWFTLQVVNISNFIIHYGGYGITALILSSLLYRYSYHSNQSVRLNLHRLSLKIPILGNILLKSSIARFSRTLAITFKAGIPLLSGLKSAGKTCGNLYIEKIMTEVYHNTAAGMSLCSSLRQADIFPELMLQMVMIGEESGSLDDVLNKTAQQYENTIDNSIDNLSKVLEPFIIVFLGGLIGGLLVAMYLPIFNLMNVIG